VASEWLLFFADAELTSRDESLPSKAECRPTPKALLAEPSLPEDEKRAA
jgi:hypothetical protein